MSNSNEIKFEPDGVKKGMDTLENVFTQFANTLSELNHYIETMINAGADSAILGEYGTRLFQIWSANASSFGDFHANFEAWSEVVAIISANNEDFVVKTVDLYRDSGATLNGVKEARKFVSENGRTGDFSSLSENAQKVMGSASVTTSVIEGGFIVYKTVGADGSTTEVKKNKNGKVVREIVCDKNGNKIREMFTNEDGTYVIEEFDGNGKMLSYTQYDSNNDIIKQNQYQEENNQEENNQGEVSIEEGVTYDSFLEVGQSIPAEAQSGLEGEFTYEGLSQRGDMTQEQIFSDKNGNLYYYEDGVMKPVNIETKKYTGTGNYNRNFTTSYDQQATVDDLGNKKLYFQDSNGNYNKSDVNVSYTTNVDTDGAIGSVNDYTSKAGNYKTFDKDADYEGKGTTLYYPSGVPAWRDKNPAKEMMTTSVIDVRNNLAKEVTEMQTYYDMHPELRDTEVGTELLNQINYRNDLVTQMSEDVQFGMAVTDGKIGDYGTFSTNTSEANRRNAFNIAVNTIKGYEKYIEDNLISMDEVLGK
ncbi:MAG: hypothetical protein K2H20_02680 [Bacilli bacterium]|nr:hypothetical protein [Bacilli bacterium]